MFCRMLYEAKALLLNDTVNQISMLEVNCNLLTNSDSLIVTFAISSGKRMTMLMC